MDYFINQLKRAREPSEPEQTPPPTETRATRAETSSQRLEREFWESLEPPPELRIDDPGQGPSSRADGGHDSGRLSPGSDIPLSDTSQDSKLPQLLQGLQIAETTSNPHTPSAAPVTSHPLQPVPEHQQLGFWQAPIPQLQHTEIEPTPVQPNANVHWGQQPKMSGSGSLFDRITRDPPQQQQASGSSLFGGAASAATSAPAQGGGLFGAAAQQSSAPASSASTLFGSTPANQQSSTGTSSLFSQPQQQQQQQNTSAGTLFGTSKPQQTTIPSLFGAANQNASSATPASGASSLFGGASATTTTTSQPQQTSNLGSGLFGGGATQQQQQQQPTLGSGLFGSTTTQQQQQPSTLGSGLFGGASSQPQQTQAQPSTSLFGSSLLTNQPGQQQQQQTQAQAAATQGEPAKGALTTTAQFHELLQRTKKRQAPADFEASRGDLPSLQLNLGDISGKLKSLGGREITSEAKAGGDSRAQYLLAASGVPRGTTLKDLNDFSTQAGQAYTTAQPDTSTDLDAWYDQLQSKTTLDMINDSVEQSKRDFDVWLEDRLQMSWDDQKRRIYEHFGLTKPKDLEENGADGNVGTAPQRGAFGKSSRRGGPADKFAGSGSFRGSGMTRSVLGNSKARGISHASVFTDVAEKAPSTGFQSAQENPFLRTKQEKYILKVWDLNGARNTGNLFPIVSEFGRVEAEAGNDVPRHLSEGYLALKHIVKENENAKKLGDEGAVKERQYAKSYLDHDANSTASVNLRKQIINGSREFLESSFWSGLEEFIAKNPREANLGGTPSKINKVRAYVRIRVARKDLGVDTSELKMLDDDYLWALLFFLLRAGLVKEALQYVRDNARAIKSMEHHSFPDWFASFANNTDRRIPRQAAQEMNARYMSSMTYGPDNAVDPYRQAVYKIIARCDLGRKNVEGISASMEDWLWVLFSLAREVNKAEEIAGEVFGLDDARKIIEEIGNRHFVQAEEGGTQYATYFLLLVLCGLFERAVSWLYPFNYVSAVHFAIALDYYGLLRIADFGVSENELLTYNFRGEPQISFARLIGYYTRDFRLSRADSATDYLTLLCLNADLPGETGRAQIAICHEALKELVLETREFALLLGDISYNGDRVSGVIEDRMKLLKLQNDTDFLRRLTIQAAAVADDAGRTTDAVLLYHLAGEYDNVIAICNRALSEAISVEIGQEQMRLQPLKPRTQGVQDPATHQQQQDGQQPQSNAEPNLTLSLTSVDDPAVLARNMMSLYAAHAPQYAKIREANREACARLLAMHDIKSAVARAAWPAALDLIERLDLLPMRASGDVSAIRAYAQNFSSLPTSVARNIGHLLIWTIECCGRQRAAIRASEFVKGGGIEAELLQKARDLMVFAGLVRYKLPPDVFEVLARAGQVVD